jgi:hypothetical protein
LGFWADSGRQKLKPRPNALLLAPLLRVALPTEAARVQETKSRPTHASSGSRAIRDRVSIALATRALSLDRRLLLRRIGSGTSTTLPSAHPPHSSYSQVRGSFPPFRIRSSSSPGCLVSKTSLTVDVARVLPAPPPDHPQGWTPPVSQLLVFTGTFVTSMCTMCPPRCAVTDPVFPHVLIRV